MADDKHNIQGTPDGDVEADTASGGAPDDSDQSETTAEPETTSRPRWNVMSRGPMNVS